MNASKNIRIAALGTIAVALAAGGAAVAASKLHGSGGSPASGIASGSFVSSGTGGRRFAGPGFGHHHGDGLAAAVTYLGITQAALETQLRSGKTRAQIADATSGKSASGLVDALVAAEKTEIQADVAAGHITQAQADQAISGLEARVTDMVDHTGPPHGGPGGPGGGGDELAAAAGYLGLSAGDLATQLQSGKTLAQVADATAGKSRAGLIAALVAAEKTELTQAVKDGKLTQAQADQTITGLEQRFTDCADGVFRGHHGHGGPPPGAPEPSPSGDGSNGTHI